MGNIIERFRKGRKVHTKLSNNKTAGERNVGNFLKLKGEAFWRRVNSDGTLTKVEDGKNGTIDYKQTPEKVFNNTRWRIALKNTIDPTMAYPKNFIEGIHLRNKVKEKELNNPEQQDYVESDDLGVQVADAAWSKYLGLNYNPNLLPSGVYDNRTNYKENTVRLPKELELEIPTDTTMLKNRIAQNERLLDTYPYKSVKVALGVDRNTLKALRHTYATGEPVGINEMSFNSRQWGLTNSPGSSPLNVLQNYNIRYDKDTNRMYYSDEYGFDNENYGPLKLVGSNLDQYLEGQPFRFRGYIDLNK